MRLFPCAHYTRSPWLPHAERMQVGESVSVVAARHHPTPGRDAGGDEDDAPLGNKPAGLATLQAASPPTWVALTPTFAAQQPQQQPVLAVHVPTTASKAAAAAGTTVTLTESVLESHQNGLSAAGSPQRAPPTAALSPAAAAPPPRKEEEKQADDKGDEEVEEEEEGSAATDYGELLHPHAFAMQLLQHDLRHGAALLPKRHSGGSKQPSQAKPQRPDAAHRSSSPHKEHQQQQQELSAPSKSLPTRPSTAESATLRPRGSAAASTSTSASARPSRPASSTPQQRDALRKSAAVPPPSASLPAPPAWALEDGGVPTPSATRRAHAAPPGQHAASYQPFATISLTPDSAAAPPAPASAAAGSSAGSGAGYGELLHPHDFAMALVKHDLSNMPDQDLADQARQRRLASAAEEEQEDGQHQGTQRRAGAAAGKAPQRRPATALGVASSAAAARRAATRNRDATACNSAHMILAGARAAGRPVSAPASRGAAAAAHGKAGQLHQAWAGHAYAQSSPYAPRAWAYGNPRKAQQPRPAGAGAGGRRPHPAASPSPAPLQLREGEGTALLSDDDDEAEVEMLPVDDLVVLPAAHHHEQPPHPQGARGKRPSSPSPGPASRRSGDGHGLAPGDWRGGESPQPAAQASRPQTAPSGRGAGASSYHTTASAWAVDGPPAWAEGGGSEASSHARGGARPAWNVRPASALPHSGGSAAAGGGKRSGSPSGPGGRPRSAGPRQRPASAHPLSRPAAHAPAGDAPALCTTAEVELASGRRHVSVYVADVAKKVGEANRHAAALGLAHRYRLRAPTAAGPLEVELYDARWQPPPSQIFDAATPDDAWEMAGALHEVQEEEEGEEGQEAEEGGRGADELAAPRPRAPALRRLGMSAFLAAFARLRQQAAGHQAGAEAQAAAAAQRLERALDRNAALAQGAAARSPGLAWGGAAAPVAALLDLPVEAMLFQVGGAGGETAPADQLLQQAEPVVVARRERPKSAAAIMARASPYRRSSVGAELSPPPPQQQRQGLVRASSSRLPPRASGGVGGHKGWRVDHHAGASASASALQRQPGATGIPGIRVGGFYEPGFGGEGEAAGGGAAPQWDAGSAVSGEGAAAAGELLLLGGGGGLSWGAGGEQRRRGDAPLDLVEQLEERLGVCEALTARIGELQGEWRMAVQGHV